MNVDRVLSDHRKMEATAAKRAKDEADRRHAELVALLAEIRDLLKVMAPGRSQ
jgi:large-conductance mechanosensitive channel